MMTAMMDHCHDMDATLIRHSHDHVTIRARGLLLLLLLNQCLLLVAHTVAGTAKAKIPGWLLFDPRRPSMRKK